MAFGKEGIAVTKRILLIATGGTTKAVINLIEKLGGKVVKVGFVMELAGFGAKDTVLKGYDVESLISYPDK